MSGERFTPGPWHVGMGPDYHIIGSGGQIVAVAQVERRTPEELAANRKLMAGAPRLYAALERAFFALGRAGGNTIGSPYRAEWEEARAALALAGRTT